MDAGRISEGPGGSPGVVSSASDKGGIRSVLARESYSVSRAFKPPLKGCRGRFFPSFFQILTSAIADGAEALEPALARHRPDPDSRRARIAPDRVFGE